MGKSQKVVLYHLSSESLFKEKEELQTKVVQTLPVFDPPVNKKAFIAKVRAELFHLVRLMALGNLEEIPQALANAEEWPLERLEQSVNAILLRMSA